MKISDLRSLPPGIVVEADVCIIGSGPAGTTILHELAGSGLRVVALESGGYEKNQIVDTLCDIENVGWPRHPEQALARPRIIGGASSLWTGRCAPFDEIDYQSRSWVPHSGWPFGPELLAPFHDRAASHLGLGVGSGYTGGDFWRIARRGGPKAAIKSETLLPFFWQYSRDAAQRYDAMHFGRSLRARAVHNAQMFLNATVTQINVNADASSVKSVEAASLEGERWTIQAPIVVLCTGGIDNARLLLASNRVVPAGLGNGRDLVGRFLMDHPRGAVASFNVSDYAALRRYFTLHNVTSPAGSHIYCQGLRLNPAVQKREALLNSAAWLTEIITPDDPWSALKRVLSGKANLRKDGPAILGNLGLFASGIRRHLIQRSGLPRKIVELKLSCIVEQRPDPDSRVTLSGRADRLGVPISRIDWRMNEQEQHTFRRTGELVSDAIAAQGLRRPELEEWVAEGAGFPESFMDNAHPTGTTRMADDPSQGVVDRDCQVHGISGLYIAGSSVFPTSGHANPTQNIVALAIRLADKLKQVAPTRGREPTTVSSERIRPVEVTETA